jgi:uroporphyrin-III C-methyltransferase/precorrin-2 dehydrogenase/sirohydrochlorin ferrochelatase
VFVDLVGQRCVVIGDGKLAAEKLAGLRDAGAYVRVIPSREYRPGALAGARLVIDASDDPEVNRQTWAEAEAAGIMINVVDRPAQCRFIAPAIVNRDPLLIAISTSGESPFLAATLRVRLERWLGREWGPFTALVGRVRRDLRERGVPIAEQTRIYRRLLTSDVRDLIRAGETAAAQRVTATLSRPLGRVAGRVALVGAGPGDPGLLTVRAREMLADADYVLHDALVSAETLALCGPSARLEDVGKRAGRASARQEAINDRLIELARQGYLVVRVKGGDPFVFGRGGEELRALVEAGVDVVVVPGVSAAIAAPAAAGIPLTMRGVSSSLAVTTGEGDASSDRIARLAVAADTLVVLMAHVRLSELTSEIAAVLGPGRPAAVVSCASLPEQKVVTGTLGDLAARSADADIRAPATLIVGEVVAQVASRHRPMVDLARFG